MPSVSLHRSFLLGRKGFRLLRLVQIWIATRRSRIALGHLDTYLLDDIGLSAAQAEAEAHRPFWNS